MTGQAMYELATELFPINRSLTGPGYRETLAILERVAGPMERHTFATGEQVHDWEIPREWTLREAWVKGPGGELVVSLEESNLHVVGYSAPVRATLSLEELQPHLHSLREQPEATPYRTTYYREDWGFCLPDSRRRELPDGDYEVLIDSTLEPGAVELGEIVVEGTGPSEVLFSTYCCHPSMANNELSGPVVAAHLARALRDRHEDRPPRHTYRFLFAPETIGAIAYLARFGDRLREHLAAGYVLTCCGDRGDFNYKRSRRGDSLADRVAEHVLGHSGLPYWVHDFVPLGSDERQYCSPGYDLPVGSLMRSTYDSFPEYHTSLDDLSLITAEALGETLTLYTRIAATLEANETLVNTAPHGEPQLGRRGLYPTTGGAGEAYSENRLADTMWLLNLCDGDSDLLAVAERCGRPIWELAEAAAPLREEGLLRPDA